VAGFGGPANRAGAPVILPWVMIRCRKYEEAAARHDQITTHNNIVRGIGGMRGTRRLCAVTGGLLCSFHVLTSAAAVADNSGSTSQDARWSLEAGLESFRWREHDDDGQRLLTEQGPRFVYGATLGNFFHADAGVIVEMRLGGLLGEVDYDGQDNNGRYVGTVTDYSGLYSEIDGGYRFVGLVQGVTIDLFGGLGMDDWRREIDGSVNSIGQTVSGFTEDYDVNYLRYGIGFTLREAYPNGYLQVGFRRPFSISEQVKIQGQTVNLSPGERASAFLTYRIMLGREGSYVKFYYAGYRLKKSETEVVGPNQVWQPRSDTDTLGIVLGYVY
jgi:hypothetical protein